MLLRKRSPHVPFMTGVRFNGPLDLRAPEDRFAAEGEIEERLRKPMEVPWINKAIEALDAARYQGSDDAEVSILDKIVRETAAHFSQQGVPPFARPLLPPQIVEREAESVRRLPEPQRATAVQHFVDKLEPSVRPGVAQHLGRLLQADHVGGALRQDDPMLRAAAPLYRDSSNFEDEADGEPAFKPLAAPPARSGQPDQDAMPADERAPEERRAKFAGGKVVPGPKGSTRTYRMGNQAVQVPSGQDENDMVAGMNYVANSGPDAPAAFMNDKSGDGVIALDRFGRPMRRRGAPIRYSWEQLRQLGALEKARGGEDWPPSEKGMDVRWDAKPSEKANLPPSWPSAQAKYRWGDGSDAVIDPDDWDVEKDADVFAQMAQRAANGERGFKPTLSDAIAMAEKTGKPQPIDILLTTEGFPTNARGQVMGYYGVRVRGYVIVKDGRYMIVGRAVVEDSGKFNYDLDNWNNRSILGKTLLVGTRLVKDPTFPLVPIGAPGADYRIRANREASVRIWGTVPKRRGRDRSQ